MLKRSGDAVARRWSSNRSASIVMLGLAVIALMFVVKMILNYSHQFITNQRLEAIRADIAEENENLEAESELLRDTDYYAVYIREEFQLHGDNVIKIPRD